MTLVKPGELGSWQDVKGMELTCTLACPTHRPRPELHVVAFRNRITQKRHGVR